MTFHCLIVGSRGYTDYASFKAECDALLAGRTDIEIVTGGASGTDAMAGRYALERGYSLQIFPADWSRYGKRAGYVRSREMHSYISTFADRGVIAFWDGASRGHGPELRPGEGVRQSAQGYPNRFMPQLYGLLSFIYALYRYAVKSSKF